MHDYDIENQFELGDLAESEDELEHGGKRTSFDGQTRINGRANVGKSRDVRAKKEQVEPKRVSSLR